jgi:hypothetical protein
LVDDVSTLVGGLYDLPEELAQVQREDAEKSFSSKIGSVVMGNLCKIG